MPEDKIQVRHESALDIGELIQTLTRAGYPAAVAQGSTRFGTQDKARERQEEVRALFKLTLIATLLALPVFLIEMGSHLSPSISQSSLCSSWPDDTWRPGQRVEQVMPLPHY